MFRMEDLFELSTCIEGGRYADSGRNRSAKLCFVSLPGGTRQRLALRSWNKGRPNAEL